MFRMSESSVAATGSPHESRWRRALGWLGVDVREGEGAIAVLLFLFFFMAITFQYVSKAVRQSKFVDSLGPEMLPVVWLILAICAIPVILLYNRAVDRFQRHNVIAGTCAVVAVSVVGFALIIQSDALWVPIAFYVFVSIAYVLIVSQFWAYSNFILDPRQGKRLFGFIGAGGLAGGAMGGYIAGLVSGIAGSRMTLLVSAGILSLTIVVIYVVQRVGVVPGGGGDEPDRRATDKTDKLEAAKGGLEAILDSRHLTLIAALMFTTVVVANIIDLQFNWAMVEALPPDMDKAERFDALTGGFGNFYVLMSGSAFVFQLLFTSRIHRRLGIGFAMRVLPIAMLFGTAGIFLAVAVVPGILLNVCRLLKIGENGLRYSLDQATRELLFFPVPTGARLKAKAYIDVFVQRSAKAGAGILLLPVTFGLMTVVQAGFMSIALIVIWFGITGALRRQYVISFRDGLQRRAVDTAVAIDLTDVTGLEVLVEALGSGDQRQVMHSLELLEYFDKGNLVTPLLVRHESAAVRHKTLDLLAATNRTDAIPLIEEVLGDEDPEVRSAAMRALVILHGDTAAADMEKQLDDPNRGVRATAIASILTSGNGAVHADARTALEHMVGSADIKDRCAATDVMGGLEEPAFQEDRVQLLY
ncbi:MAG: MFS transporter, partial [Acidobacteria bacterium]|nr:MFS transporter [Acidobacteriota bacterium]